MSGIFQDFFNILNQYLPNADSAFGKNTNITVLNEINAKVKNNLPQDVIDFYKEVNGEACPIGSILGFYLMSIEKVAMEYAHLCNSPRPLDIVSHPKEMIKEGGYNPMWIPIAEDGGGSFFVLDLEPDSKGTLGQIITIDGEYNDSYVVARSFTELITEIIPNELEEENLFVAEDESLQLFEWIDGHYFNKISERFSEI